MGYMLNLPKKAAVGAATLVAIVGAGGTAWAVESSATTPTPASANAPVPAPGGTTTPGHGPNARRGGRIAALINRADHGTLEIRTKSGWETVDYDRGKVTASSATSITLLRPDGQSVTDAVTSTTKYHGPGSVAVVGKPARVVSLNGDALIIAQGGGAKGGTGASTPAPPASAGGGASA
jgi:hypothetical protein